MADYRMLEKLQEVRRIVCDLQWSGSVSPEKHFEQMCKVQELLTQAIDLDEQILREKLGLIPTPKEADAGSWEEYQHIKKGSAA